MFVYTLRDIIGFGSLSVFVAVWIIAVTLRWVKQAQCKHERVFETGACDAVCTSCGKNLGFIGTWRERHAR